MYVEDGERRQAGDGVVEICTQHGQAQIFQCGGEGGRTTHRSFDGTGGHMRGSSTAELKILMGKDMISDNTPYVKTTSRGGGDVFENHRVGIHDAAANGGVSVLNLPGDMAFDG